MPAPRLALAIPLLTACAAPVPPAPPPMTGPIPVAPAAEQTKAPAPADAEPPPATGDKFKDVVIKVHKVAGSVYVLEGSGGNIAVSVGDDGVVLVDDQFAPLAGRIKAALHGITDKPIRIILNTHWHGDHTGGNAIFGRAAPIVAHENVRRRLMAGKPRTERGGKILESRPPAPAAALPILTFQDKVSVHLNGEEIRAIHIPPGHTDGDIIVYFTRSNVVHMGDDFVTYGFPFVDLESGGSVKGIIAAMDRVVKELPPDVLVIPGHGAVSTLEDVKKLSATLKDCVKRVEAEVKKKKTLDQIKQAKVLAPYDSMGKAFISADTFVEIIYEELTKKR